MVFRPSGPDSQRLPAISQRRALDYANEQLDSSYSRIAKPILRILVKQLDDPILRGLWDQIEARLSVGENSDDQDAARAARNEAKSLTRQLISVITDRMPAVERATRKGAAALQAEAIQTADEGILRESFGVETPKALKQLGVSWNKVDYRTIEAAEDYVSKPEFAKRLKGITPSITDRIITGIFEGQGPLTTARQLRRDLPSMAAYEINRLMRTTQLNSYRNATARIQYANAKLFAYQIRIAARDDRCCLACWALHGKKYAVGEIIYDHEQGRCRGIAIPVGKEIDFPTGAELWDRLSPERQRAIAGAAAFNAMQQGGARLLDFVQYDRDPLFGYTVREKSVLTMFGPELAPKFYAVNQGKPDMRYKPFRGSLDEAATSGEMASWFRRKYPNLEYQIGVDLPVPNVKAALRAFDKLATEFPQVAASMRGLATDDRGRFFNENDNNWQGWASHQGAGGANTIRGGWINLSAYWLKQPDNPEPGGYGNWRMGGAANTWQTVMEHEFGHQIHYWIEANLAKKSFTGYGRASGFGYVGDSLNKWLDKYKPKAKSLSEYALTNKYELFTESFVSMRYIPRAKWSTHTKRFAKVFDYITESKFHDDLEYLDYRTKREKGLSDEEFEAEIMKLADIAENIFEFTINDI